MIQRTLSSLSVVSIAVLCAVPPPAGPGPDAASPPGDSAPGTRPTGTQSDDPPPADHHMHVWSENARDALLRLLEESREGEPPQVPVFDGDQVVAELDAAGIERGVLLSTAYFFGSPDVAFENEYRQVRRENDWVARQVERHPERLVAFFGVNPLADYAVEEAERCASTPACVGMKIQLANSDVDFHEDADVQRLRSFFGELNRLGLPVVVHLQTRREDFGGKEVDVFVDEVLPAAPEIPVQVAHMGGNSRFDPPTERAVAAFVEAFEDHPGRTANVYFDMGLVPFPLQRARGDTATRKRYERWNRLFAEAVRTVGPDRIVFGTDYPEARPGRYVRRLRASLPMEDEEIRDLFDDRAPYLR